MAFNELKQHAGHVIVCVTYGKSQKGTVCNVALECEDCGAVLLDIDNPKIHCPKRK